jgi:hypothetical protein
MRWRNFLLLLVALTAMLTVAGLSASKKSSLLLLDWASKSPQGQWSDDKPWPVALLIELGLKDTEPTQWTNRAVVSGAKVVHREGYRFRAGDKLTNPDGWSVSSHYGLRVPPRQPAVRAMEALATVGIVLHLSDLGADATLTLEPGTKKDAKAEVAIKDLLSGQKKTLWDGAVTVRRITTAHPLSPGAAEEDFPAAAYGPDGTFWTAYIAYHLKDKTRQIEQNPLMAQPADFKAFHAPGFGDQLFLTCFQKGAWRGPLALTGANEDLIRCALAVEGDGTAWVIYSANRKGKYNLYARPIRVKGEPGPEQQLTDGPGPDLTPVACTDQAGNVRVSYQTWRPGGEAMLALLTCSKGQWSSGLTNTLEMPHYTFGGQGNNWIGAITAGPKGEVATAYDVYENGDYDIGLHVQTDRSASNSWAARSPSFEARPSLCYDEKGRLWIAYEEGPAQWGKDYGALAPDQGNPLYSSRSVRVVCLDNGQLFRPVAELPLSNNTPPHIPYEGQVGPNYERGQRFTSPHLGLDGKGRLWLTYREKFGTRYSTHPGSYWLSFARRLDGDHWSEPIEIHHSDGLLDHRPVLLPHANGGLLIIYNGDGRYTNPDHLANRVFQSWIDLPSPPVEPKLVPHELGVKQSKGIQEEREAVKAIRAYRIEAGGKKYQLLRGEFHRHTEMSWDGGPDGSLEDMFRYAIDAASLDWIGNGDHDSGAGREYSWWLIQKYTDAFHVPRQLTPMFTYERSVAYPHGHRNCVFAKRGMLPLPRLAEPDPEKRVAGVHADDTKMLYRYLKELDGICAVHTSATNMGTDWRDNDPEVEPLVEIYQGDRMSYELEGAPRAGYEAKSGKTPVNVAGWFPKGFINFAFEKGYRLGFESSSDHWSTHISYCIVLAERHDRESILAAMKKRHCYGATDNIIVDLRSGTHLMGDAFQTNEPPSLQMHVIGTTKLQAIHVLKDSKIVDTIKPAGREYWSKWTDPNPTAGTHYYYLRIEQEDKELAWASPLWIDCNR